MRIPFLLILTLLIYSKLKAQSFAPEDKNFYRISRQTMEKANVLKLTVTFISSDKRSKLDSMLSTIGYYDSIGRIVLLRTNPLGNEYRQEFFYQNDLLTRIINTDFRTSAKIIHDIEYDASLNPVTEKLYTVDSPHLVTYYYTYNNNNQLLKITQEINNKATSFSRNYFYQNNKLIRMEEYEKDKNLYSLLFEYGENSNTRTMYYQIRRLKKKIKMEDCIFNNKGQLIEKETFTVEADFHDGRSLIYNQKPFSEYIFYNENNTISHRKTIYQGKEASLSLYQYFSNY